MYVYVVHCFASNAQLWHINKSIAMYVGSNICMYVVTAYKTFHQIYLRIVQLQTISYSYVLYVGKFWRAKY